MQVKLNGLDPKLEMLEFPRNDIEYIMDIGQGAFGRVFQAHLIRNTSGIHRIGRGKGGSLNGSKHNLSCGKNCKHNHSIGHNHCQSQCSSKTDIHSQQRLQILSSSPKEEQWLQHEHNLHSLSRSVSGDDSLHKHYPLNIRDGVGDSHYYQIHNHCHHYHHSNKQEEEELVAVKMLKEDASETVQTDFEREASLMVQFDHPNIIRLLGVCTLGKPMCLIFEYMNKGDLNGFLRSCSPDQCLIHDASQHYQEGLPPTTDVDTLGSSLDTVDQLHLARQVAAGMAYLADRGYVHRDLATRNCLVGTGLVVKIADFGLARSIHSANYYHGTNKDAIPIRWMPPESILYNKFSSQSDVWSFGVLLWEVFSFALQPYYGKTHEQVIDFLCNGNMLERPSKTPLAVYDLMKGCWRRRPRSRPSFNSLLKSLDSMWEERYNKMTRKARQPVPV